jgi:hypothetical protein
MERAQERLAIHELVRLGLGRQDDLRLLRNVGLLHSWGAHDACVLCIHMCVAWRTSRLRGRGPGGVPRTHGVLNAGRTANGLQVAIQSSTLPGASCQQLLREAALREEWRAGREAGLLAKLRGSGLVALTQQDGQMLSEQLHAFVQVTVPVFVGGRDGAVHRAGIRSAAPCVAPQLPRRTWHMHARAAPIGSALHGPRHPCPCRARPRARAWAPASSSLPRL